MSIELAFLLTAAIGLALAAIIVFVVLVNTGFFNDPDGKESNPEYWQALKEMREEEKKNGKTE